MGWTQARCCESAKRASARAAARTRRRLTLLRVCARVRRSIGRVDFDADESFEGLGSDDERELEELLGERL